MKHFNANVDNNTTNIDTNDDTYNAKIRDKIGDIRVIHSRLGDIVTKGDRVKIKKELYEIENKKNLFLDGEKEKIYDNLVELVNRLPWNKIYWKIFDNIDDDYYKPILVKGSFNESYKYYESRCDKDKKLSIEQYLHVIKPYLSDLINENKAVETSSN